MSVLHITTRPDFVPTKTSHMAMIFISSSFLCPALSMVLHNTYGAPTRLFVTGQGEISSREGTTQGNHLAMSMYVLAMVPLIRQLRSSVLDASQLWSLDLSLHVGKFIV